MNAGLNPHIFLLCMVVVTLNKRNVEMTTREGRCFATWFSAVIEALELRSSTIYVVAQANRNATPLSDAELLSAIAELSMAAKKVVMPREVEPHWTLALSHLSEMVQKTILHLPVEYPPEMLFPGGDA